MKTFREHFEALSFMRTVIVCLFFLGQASSQESDYKISPQLTQKPTMANIDLSVHLSPEPAFHRGRGTEMPSFSEVMLLDYLGSEEYFKVNFGGEIGFVPLVYIIITDEVKQFMEDHSKLFRELKKKQAIIESNRVWINVFEANVRANPSKNSAIIGKLEKGIPVFIQDAQGYWLSIKYDYPLGLKLRYESEENLNKSYIAGWVHSSLVSSSKVSVLSYYQKRIEKYVRLYPSMSVVFRNAILRGSVILGMTKGMVVVIEGSPDDINRTVGSFGVHEQWVYYGGEIMSNRYLYFENGILTSWQD